MSTIEALNYDSIGGTPDSMMDITNVADKRIVETFEEQPKNEEVVMDQEIIDEIYGDKEKIIKFLKERCLIPKEGEEAEHVKEFSGEKGTHYSLILPSVNGFKCKKLDWYISDKECSYVDFKKINNLEEIRETKNGGKISRDSKVIADVLLMLRDFFGALGVSTDANINSFEDALYGSLMDTSHILKEIANFKDEYWLRTDPYQPLSQFDCKHYGAFITVERGPYRVMGDARLFKMSISEIG